MKTITIAAVATLIIAAPWILNGEPPVVIRLAAEFIRQTVLS